MKRYLIILQLIIFTGFFYWTKIVPLPLFSSISAAAQSPVSASIDAYSISGQILANKNNFLTINSSGINREFFIEETTSAFRNNFPTDINHLRDGDFATVIVNKIGQIKMVTAFGLGDASGSSYSAQAVLLLSILTALYLLSIKSLSKRS